MTLRVAQIPSNGRLVAKITTDRLPSMQYQAIQGSKSFHRRSRNRLLRDTEAR